MDTNEARIYTAVLISGIVIGAIIIYFAITMLRNHRRHFKMLRQNFLEEMELLEKERNRIARDLHDELGPILAVTKIHIHATEGALPEDQHHLETAIHNIDVLTTRFSGIAKNLTPRLLIRKGLETALSDFFEQYNEVSTIKMNLTYRIKNEIYISTSLQIYRIVQELLHNAVKHSGATELLVQLQERKRKIYLFYKDNGKGLDSEPEKEQGLGLSSLQNRAEMLGGKMTCITNKKEGTEYFFEIPLKKNHEKSNRNSNSR